MYSNIFTAEILQQLINSDEAKLHDCNYKHNTIL